MSGGNTDELYSGNGRWKMALSLKEQHQESVKIKFKWNRWQHVVDYTPFRKNKLIRKSGLNIKKGTNNYGMVLADKGFI